MTAELYDHWLAISARVLDQHPDTARGKMMSAEALTFAGRVFVFFSTKGGQPGLGCRIGRETHLDALNLTDAQHLAPFKTKPPMKDWIVAGAGDLQRWEELAELCLELARTREEK